MHSVFKLFLTILFFSFSTQIFAQTIDKQTYVDLLTKYENSINQLEKTNNQLVETTKKLELTNNQLEKTNNQLQTTNNQLNEKNILYDKLVSDYSDLNEKFITLSNNYKNDIKLIDDKYYDRLSSDQKEITDLKSSLKSALDKIKTYTICLNGSFGYALPANAYVIGIMGELKIFDPVNIFTEITYQTDNRITGSIGIGINF